MIDMWYNFRQMCFNSQEFLASQIKVAQAQNSVINNGKGLQQMRVEVIQRNAIDIKDIQLIEPPTDEQYDDIDFIEDEDDGDGAGNATDPDFLYGDDDDDDSDIDVYKEDREMFTAQDPMTAISQKLLQSDLTEALTPEDYEEAINYIQAENDENIEKLIEHCATKNTALRMLRRKAIGSLMREKLGNKKPSPIKKEPREKPMKPSIFMCNICGNVYSKKPLFQYHMRMHSEVKPYQCE